MKNKMFSPNPISQVVLVVNQINKSIGITDAQRIKDFSSASKMLIPGDRCYPFGCKNCINANITDEIVSTDSKNIAKLLYSDKLQILKLLNNFPQISNAILRLIISQDALFIHVFPSSFEVDVSNSIVENAFYFL